MPLPERRPRPRLLACEQSAMESLAATVMLCLAATATAALTPSKPVKTAPGRGWPGSATV